MKTEMTGTDTAIIDCLYSIIEVLVARTNITHADFKQLFERQLESLGDKVKASDGTNIEKLGSAVAVFTLMIGFCKRAEDAPLLASLPPGGHS